MPAGSLLNQSARHPLSSPRGIWSALHIDPILLFLLLTLIAGGGCSFCTAGPTATWRS